MLRELGEGIYANSPTGYKVVKYDWNNKKFNQLFFVNEVWASRRPLLQCDIIGDWREELLLAEKDGSRIRLYTTNIPTEYNLTTLMHDPKYRLDIATQPSGYSQPPWPGYYIGHNNFEYPSKGKFVYNTIPAPAIDDSYDIEHNNLSLVLTIGRNTAVLNGEEIKIDENSSVVPFIENSRTLVPLRFIGEALEYSVEYDEQTHEVTMTSSGKIIKLHINSDVYTINSEEHNFDVKVQTYNDRTFVPVRALSEIIGMNVEWNDGTINIHD